MKLTPEAREAVNAALIEAHAVLGKQRTTSRHIAYRFVTAIREMEPSGAPWVPVYLDDLAMVGALKVCSDWRRRQHGRAKTKKGTAVPVPLWAAVTDKRGEPIIATFGSLTAAELRECKEALEAQRNTLSREITYYRDLLAVMEQDAKVTTAGQAMSVLERAA